MARWKDLQIWDGTADPGAEAMTLRSPMLEELLQREGWTYLGLLAVDGTRLANMKKMHRMMQVQYVPIWRAPRGGTVGAVQRLYGVDSLEQYSLFEDGTVLRTRWTSRDGGIAPSWYPSDPRLSPPEEKEKERSDGEILAKYGTDTSARFFTRVAQSPGAEEALVEHAEWMEDTKHDAGRRVMIDVAGAGAVQRRGLSIVAQRHSWQRLLLGLVPAIVLPLLVLAVTQPFAGPAPAPEVMSMDAELPAEPWGWAPAIGTMIGAMIGAGMSILGPQYTFGGVGAVLGMIGSTRRGRGLLWAMIEPAGLPFLFASVGLGWGWTSYAAPRIEQVLPDAPDAHPLPPKELFTTYGPQPGAGHAQRVA